MTVERQALAVRIRAALPGGRAVREVSMFGGLSFMVDDSMVVAAGRDGGLLVRVLPGRYEELLTVPGARPAVMGSKHRPMGPGWISVAPDGLATDEQLAFWTQVGLEHQASSSRAFSNKAETGR